MTSNLALPTLIAIRYIALSRQTITNLVVLGEIGINVAMEKMKGFADVLQEWFDSGAMKILLPITSAVDLGEAL